LSVRTPGSRNPWRSSPVLVALTDAGRELVEALIRCRREELDHIMSGLAHADQAKVADGMRLFAQAAEEPGVKNLLVM
jgi:DNA-binding MarR family transcriptional regulator